MWFKIRVGLILGCVPSPWLFNIVEDCIVREMDGIEKEADMNFHESN